MFAITPGSVFEINSCAYTAVATSSTACGLGVACDVWFLLRYNWVDLEIFMVCTFLTLPTHHMMILLFAVAPFSRRIRLIRLLLNILTHAHLLHVVVLHLSYDIPDPHRI